MTPLAPKQLRKLLLENFCGTQKLNDDEIVRGYRGGALSKNALLGASSTLSVYSIFGGTVWEDIDTIDFFSYIDKEWMGSQKKTCFLNESIVYLTEKAWLYYLPGFLWAMIIDIKNIDKLDVLLDLVMGMLTYRSDRKQTKNLFNKRYKNMAHGKKNTIAECLVFISQNTGKEYLGEFALNSYWVNFLNK